jgi:HSP20 family protein
MGFFEKLKKGIGVEEEIEVEEEKEEKKVKIEQKETKKEEKEGQLVVDMYHTSDNLFIEAPIAGVKSDQINIFLENDVLTIEGEREREEDEEREYLIKECFWGRFKRKIALPFEVNFDKAEATLKDGVLKIKIPKLKKAERKRLVIK